MKPYNFITTQAMEEVIYKVRYEDYALIDALAESPVDFTTDEIAQMMEELDERTY